MKKFVIGFALGLILGLMAMFLATGRDRPGISNEKFSEHADAPRRSAPAQKSKFSTAIQDLSSSDRTASAEAELVKIPSAELEPALKSLLLLHPGGARTRMLAALFRRWGSLDQAAALAAARNLPSYDRARAEAAAIEGWAEKEPAAAWAEARKILESYPSRGGLLLGTLRQLARADMRGALEAAGGLPSAALRDGARDQISDLALEKGEMDHLVQQIGTLTNKPEQNAWIARVFEQWGMYESAAPFQTIKALSDPSLAKSAVAGMLQGWSRTDPQGAIDFALEQQQDPQVREALGPVLQTALRGMTGAEAHAVIERLAASGLLDATAPGFILSLAQTHPAIAADAASKLSDANQRATRVSQVLATWARNNPDAAALFYETMPAPEKTAPVFGTIAMHSLQNNITPDRVFGWLDTFPAPDRAGALNALIGGLEASRSPISAATAKSLLDALAKTPGLSEDAKQRASRLASMAK